MEQQQKQPIRNEWIPLRGGLSDKKEYVYTTINGMGVLMISTMNLKESTTDLVSAAALAVQTGSFNDPEDIQGLSHYLEHMIFMGSEKYPGENEYDSFVTSHGGYCNAFTEYEYTVYSFEIPQQHFFGALDIFANCFISPLLSVDSSERELNAIESEFQLALNSDDTREEDVLCELADSSHILHKFSWGNMNSLKNVPLSRGIDINSSLRQYFDKYYFPDNSHLVVIAPYSIQSIFEGITFSFSNWRQSSTPIERPLVTYPFPQKPYLLRIVPIEKRTHSLKMIWTIPSTLFDYHSKSHEYLSHLIGHEGAGSILTTLKELDLAHEIAAGVGSSGIDENSFFSLFTITIELTSRGVLLWTHVVKIVFQYIAFLHSNGIQKWVFSEIQQLAQIEYDFEDELEVDDLLTELVISMTTAVGRAPHDLLSARHLVKHWNPDHIKEILNLLIPLNCQITLSSSLFQDGSENSDDDEDEDVDHDDDGDDGDDDDSDSESNDDEEDEEEEEELLTPEEIAAILSSLTECQRELSTIPSLQDPSHRKSTHFQVSYWKDQINEDLLTYWSDNTTSVLGSEHTLHLPPANKYIPHNFKLLPSKISHTPQIIFSSSSVRVWHQTLSRFHLPKAVISLTLLSNYLLQVTSHHSDVPTSTTVVVLNDLFSYLLHDFLLHELYMAEMASIETKIHSTMSGIVILIYGFHDKIIQFALKIFQIFVNLPFYLNLKFILSQIEKLKKKYYQYYFLSSDAANSRRLEILLPHQVSKKLCYETLHQLLKFKKSLVNLVKKYHHDFVESCCCEILINGNISTHHSTTFGNSIKNILEQQKEKKMKKKLNLKKQKLSFSSPSLVFVRTIEPISSYSLVADNEMERNVCLQLYFQIGSSLNIRDSTLLLLIQRIMEEPLFNELRTQKQLGYDISCCNCQTYSMLGYLLEVISSSHPLSIIHSHLLQFINITFFNYLKSISFEQYLIFQKAVIARLEIPPISLYEAALENWNEIEERRYVFSTKQHQLEILTGLTIVDIQQFYERYFIKESESCRMMWIECDFKEPVVECSEVK